MARICGRGRRRHLPCVIDVRRSGLEPRPGSGLELVVCGPGLCCRAARRRPDHRPNLFLLEGLTRRRAENYPDHAAGQGHRRPRHGHVLLVDVVAAELNRPERGELRSGRRIENRDHVVSPVFGNPERDRSG